MTDQRISATEQHPATERFRLPWHPGGLPTPAPVHALFGRPYRGLNVLALWAAAVQAGYDTDEWATYRQWQALGTAVKKGEKGSLVVVRRFVPSAS